MAEAANSPEFQEIQPDIIPYDERVLTEIDSIIACQKADGTLDPSDRQDIRLNKITSVQEAAMPFAVTETRHEFEHNEETGQKTFRWLGKTAVQASMSGYRYHVLEAARARVDVEVDEARYATEVLDTSRAKILISPRMTRKDATLTDARREHLGDEDSVRVSWLETSERGEIKNRVMQSLLVRDIPYEAWVAMLRDDDNIFGKSIEIEDDGSALSVMKVHRELELPVEAVDEGPITILESVVPYISDPSLRRSVMDQIKLFRGDQSTMRKVAEAKADQWLDFDISLANSLRSGRANFEVERFIIGLQEFWSQKDLSIIKQHELSDGGYKMSRSLAVVLENAKQNTLWGGAASTVANPDVVAQMNPEIVEKIQQNEALIQLAIQNGMSYQALEAQNNRLIASQNIKVGGGCSGTSQEVFGKKANEGPESNELDSEVNNSSENWSWKQGVCRVKSCAKKTEVGPCSVCRVCQAKFDRGEDPSKEIESSETISEKQTYLKIKELLASITKNGVDIELHEIIEHESAKGQPELETPKELVTV